MDYDELMERVWSNGSYEHLAPNYLPMAARLVDAANVGPEDSVLDVGTGTGNVAITAARQGADVTGVDIAPDMLDRAAANAEIAGASDVDLQTGDATNLPVSDDAFEATVSALGHMYGDPPEAAAGELCRVTRPGGRVAFTSWTPASLFPFMAGVAANHLDPADLPELSDPPFLWGDADVATGRLGARVTDPAVETRTLSVPALSPVHVWERHRTHSGIFAELLDRVDAADRPALREDMIGAVESYFDDETNAVELEYLLVTGTVV